MSAVDFRNIYGLSDGNLIAQLCYRGGNYYEALSNPAKPANVKNSLLWLVMTQKGLDEDQRDPRSNLDDVSSNFTSMIIDIAKYHRAFRGAGSRAPEIPVNPVVPNVRRAEELAIRCAECRENLGRTREELRRVMEQRDNINTRLAQLRNERDNLDRMNNANAEARDRMRNERDALRAEKDGANARIGRLGNEMDALRAERDNLDRMNNANAEARDRMRNERDALRAERDGANARIGRLGNERDALRAERDDLRDDRDGLRDQVIALRDQIDRLNNEADGFLNDIGRLNAEADRLHNDLMDARNALHNADMRNMDDDEEIMRLRDTIRRGIEEMNMRDAMIQQGLRIVQGLSAELNQARGFVRQMEADHDAEIQRIREEMERALNEAEAEYNRQIANLERQRGEWRDLAIEHDGEIDDLRDENDANRQRMQRMQNEIDRLTQSEQMSTRLLNGVQSVLSDMKVLFTGERNIRTSERALIDQAMARLGEMGVGSINELLDRHQRLVDNHQRLAGQSEAALTVGATAFQRLQDEYAGLQRDLGLREQELDDSRMRADAYREGTEELQREVARINTEKAQLEQRARALIDELEVARANEGAEGQVVDNLRGELEDLEGVARQNDDLRRRIRDLEGEVRELGNKRDELQERVAESERELRRNQAQRHGYDQEAMIQRQLKEEEHQRRKDEVDRLGRLLTEKNAELEEIRAGAPAEIARLERELDEAREEVDDLSNFSSEETRKNRRLSQELRETNRRIQELEAERENVVQGLAGAHIYRNEPMDDAEPGDLPRAVREIVEGFDRNKEELDETKRELEDVREQVGYAAENAEELEEQARAKDREIDSLQIKVEDLEYELQGLEDERDNLRKAHDGLEEQLRLSDLEYNKAEKAIKGMEKQMDKEIEVSEGLQKEVARYGEANRMGAEKIVGLEAELEDAKRELEEKIQEYDRGNKELRKEIEKQNDQIREMLSELERAKRETAEAVKINTGLNEGLEQATNDLRILTGERDQLIEDKSKFANYVIGIREDIKSRVPKDPTSQATNDINKIFDDAKVKGSIQNGKVEIGPLNMNKNSRDAFQMTYDKLKLLYSQMHELAGRDWTKASADGFQSVLQRGGDPVALRTGLLNADVSKLDNEVREFMHVFFNEDGTLSTNSTGQTLFGLSLPRIPLGTIVYLRIEGGVRRHSVGIENYFQELYESVLHGNDTFLGGSAPIRMNMAIIKHWISGDHGHHLTLDDLLGEGDDEIGSKNRWMRDAERELYRLDNEGKKVTEQQDMDMMNMNDNCASTNLGTDSENCSNILKCMYRNDSRGVLKCLNMNVNADKWQLAKKELSNANPTMVRECLKKIGVKGVYETALNGQKVLVPVPFERWVDSLDEKTKKMFIQNDDMCSYIKGMMHFLRENPAILNKDYVGEGGMPVEKTDYMEALGLEYFHNPNGKREELAFMGGLLRNSGRAEMGMGFMSGGSIPLFNGCGLNTTFQYANSGPMKGGCHGPRMENFNKVVGLLESQGIKVGRDIKDAFRKTFNKMGKSEKRLMKSYNLLRKFTELQETFVMGGMKGMYDTKPVTFADMKDAIKNRGNHGDDTMKKYISETIENIRANIGNNLHEQRRLDSEMKNMYGDLLSDVDLGKGLE